MTERLTAAERAAVQAWNASPVGTRGLLAAVRAALDTAGCPRCRTHPPAGAGPGGCGPVCYEAHTHALPCVHAPTRPAPPSPTWPLVRQPCPEGYHVGDHMHAPFMFCLRCGLPAWDHPGVALADGAGGWRLRPWPPGVAEALKFVTTRRMKEQP